MNNAVIQGEGLGKKYRRGVEWHTGLRHALDEFIRSPLSVFRRPKAEPFWALKDVSLAVRGGEVLGLIGRNGAGKTTLLKILSRITRPTEGWAEIRGRVGSLLEVGTGFHPELTGRENTFLSGAILGMSKAEIKRKFDEIVAFAEIEKFIDTPAKHYSSGMYVRLAFAVAAHLEPEILLVDEVLAVGDINFQKKCLGKMDDVARAGRTIIFVSHNLAAITRLCPRTVWIESGQVKLDSSTREVVNAYQAEGFTHRAQWIRPDSSAPNGSFKFMEIALKSAQGPCSSLYGSDEEIVVEVRYVVSRSLSGCQVGTRVVNAEGVVVFTTSDADHLKVSATPKEAGCYEAHFKIPAGLLAPGSYSLLMAAHLPQRDVYEVVDQAVAFEITGPGSLTSLDGRLGVVTPFIHWETARLRQTL